MLRKIVQFFGSRLQEEKCDFLTLVFIWFEKLLSVWFGVLIQLVLSSFYDSFVVAHFFVHLPFKIQYFELSKTETKRFHPGKL